MKGVIGKAGWLISKRPMRSACRMLFLIALTVVSGAMGLRAQCPDNGQTKVMKPSKGNGFYFYKFLGDESFRYFLDGKTFSYNNKSDPGRTFIFIDGMAYELMLEDRADFAKYIKGSKPQDILLAQAKYEQDYYRRIVPGVVITDYGPPANADDGGDDRPFYLWKKENPPGKEAATQYLVTTLVGNKVVLLSIGVVKPTVLEKDVFHQLEEYTGSFALITGDVCAKVLSAPIGR
jgi:hypothetical protein